MRNLLHSINGFFFVTLLLMLLSACGGGGGSGDKEGGGSNNPTPVSGNVNGGLTGRIFTSDGWVIDIPSGKGKRIPGIIWDSYCNDFDDVNDDFDCTRNENDEHHGRYSEYFAYPNINGDKYLLTVSDCTNIRDCFEIHSSETGELLGQYLAIYSGADAGAKISRDGNYYAYTYHDDEVAYSSTELIIRTINHDVVSRTVMPDSGAISFDWNATGGIVYAYNGSLYVTSAYTTDGAKIFDLRNYPELSNISGIGGSLRVSPDGTKIAFMLFERHSVLSYLPQTPWVINIDGSDLHRFAYVPNSMGENELFGSLSWSPDGEHILITEGYSPQATNYDSGVPGYLYAIPSDSRNVELNQEGRDAIIMLKTNYRNDSQELRYIFNGGGLWWTP